MERQPRNIQITNPELPRDTKKALKKAGFEIFRIEVESLQTLREKGTKFQSDWHEGLRFDKELAGGYEIAINPNLPVLPKSNKTILQQNKLTKKYELALTEKYKGIEAVIGRISENVQVITHSLDTWGEDIFEGRYLASQTPTEGNEIASVARLDDGIFNIISTNRRTINTAVYASPIIRRKVDKI